jgi:hypothetical protein
MKTEINSQLDNFLISYSQIIVKFSHRLLIKKFIRKKKVEKKSTLR